MFELFWGFIKPTTVRVVGAVILTTIFGVFMALGYSFVTTGNNADTPDSQLVKNGETMMFFAAPFFELFPEPKFSPSNIIIGGIFQFLYAYILISALDVAFSLLRAVFV